MPMATYIHVNSDVVNDLVSIVEGFAASNLIEVTKRIEFSFFHEGFESDEVLESV